MLPRRNQRIRLLAVRWNNRIFRDGDDLRHESGRQGRDVIDFIPDHYRVRPGVVAFVIDIDRINVFRFLVRNLGGDTLSLKLLPELADFLRPVVGNTGRNPDDGESRE